MEIYQGSQVAYYVSIEEKEIKGLILAARKIFMEQDILLELEAPIKICGGFLLSIFLLLLLLLLLLFNIFTVFLNVIIYKTFMDSTTTYWFFYLISFFF
jgi:hypothetical protein